MTSRNRRIQEGREKQYLANGEIHDWYRFVLAFPDHLVTEILDRFGAVEGETVLDPFCGTGTTLIESMKSGLHAVGIEANPVCVLASKVKTNWNLRPSELLSALDEVLEFATPIQTALSYHDTPMFAPGDDLDGLKEELINSSPEGQYFISSGMLEREWISEIPFLKVLGLLRAIKEVDIGVEVRDAMRLALAAILVKDVSNVRFGPELYVSGSKTDIDLLTIFGAKIQKMVSDLETVEVAPIKSATIIEGDSRECGRLLQDHEIESVDYVITSPPYPTEKDYTRQTRLELVFLGYIHDRKSLQAVKKAMLRSHSKGIYKEDNDGIYVADIPEVKAIADELRTKIADKTYGFAKLYPRIIEEYFGGMYRHLANLFSVLRPGGLAAYVVGDQRTYLQTFTPTGQILSIIAERIGFEVVDRLVWRVRAGTTGSGNEISEEILILGKPRK